MTFVAIVETAHAIFQPGADTEISEISTLKAMRRSQVCLFIADRHTFTTNCNAGTLQLMAPGTAIASTDSPQLYALGRMKGNVTGLQTPSRAIIQVPQLTGQTLAILNIAEHKDAILHMTWITVAIGDVAVCSHGLRRPKVVALIITDTRTNIATASDVNIGRDTGFFLAVNQRKLMRVYKPDCINQMAVPERWRCITGPDMVFGMTGPFAIHMNGEEVFFRKTILAVIILKQGYGSPGTLVRRQRWTIFQLEAIAIGRRRNRNGTKSVERAYTATRINLPFLILAIVARPRMHMLATPKFFAVKATAIGRANFAIWHMTPLLPPATIARPNSGMLAIVNNRPDDFETMRIVAACPSIDQHLIAACMTLFSHVVPDFGHHCNH